MPDKSTDLITELALANRILAHEGVLDAFGHVSVRHPADPRRYLLSRSRSPLLVEPDDILQYTLDSEPVKPAKAALYAERVIHGCIYQARRDVMAVCHHHAAAVLPFCVAGKPIVPVFHLGATSAKRRRSGTSMTNSATATSWLPNKRKAIRSPARSGNTRWC